MSGLTFTKTQGAFSPHYLVLLLAALTASILFPLLFIVLPAVFARLFLVLSRAQPLENSLLPCCPVEPRSLRSPPF